MKDMKPRSESQVWQSERCWSNSGRLSCAIALLSQVAKCKSTLIGEANEIRKATEALSHISKTWDDKLYREASRKLYLKRSI
jgi:hypothetical protein